MTQDQAALRKPKRVLMTADTVGGVWTYALDLARALQGQGVEVVLATMGRRLSREQRREVNSAGWDVQVCESAYKLEWMEEPWSDVAQAGEWLLDLEARLKPNLIHLNGYSHGALPWHAPKVLVGHSCVLSWWQAVHGESAPENWHTYRMAVRAGLRAADLVVAPSHAMLRALETHYGPLGRTRVIANGRRLPSLVSRPKEKFILSAGRLWDRGKNVEALAAVASQLPWPVYLAGEDQAPGGQRRHYQDVQTLGHLGAAQLQDWFARASLYALPARYEPFGLSVLEAAQAGCALVLGDIPSLREIWGNAALFVPPEEPRALKEALSELISSPAWMAALGAKARWAARRFTPERMVESYLLAYSEVLTSLSADAESRSHRLGRSGPKAASRTRKRSGRAIRLEELAA